ncbi:predicted protein [Botrytis cinerea T4]|uniref:Uncharacterized protein n=1 Tax=Botryotinia fuckeliana (strain T4) TaxID=999810 RepID=G2YGT9_BOTF4|nr:predicted protein [Botrytis cinerea T4]
MAMVTPVTGSFHSSIRRRMYEGVGVIEARDVSSINSKSETDVPSVVPKLRTLKYKHHSLEMSVSDRYFKCPTPNHHGLAHCSVRSLYLWG